MSDQRTTPPSVKSMVDWSVRQNLANGRLKVSFELTDAGQAEAWFQWLLYCFEEATNKLDRAEFACRLAKRLLMFPLSPQPGDTLEQHASCLELAYAGVITKALSEFPPDKPT